MLELRITFFMHCYTVLYICIVCVCVCGCVCVQMYVNALIKRAGIFAGQQNMDKCKTCLEKALAVCPDSIDVLVHRARVSLF